MQLIEALNLLNSKFRYQHDTFKWFDQWNIIASEEKLWYGDCEDYSLTLAWLISDRNIVKFIWKFFTFQFIMWFVKAPNGEGHAIIKIEKLYYDNIQKKGATKTELKEKGYKFVYPFVFPILVLKFVLSFISRPFTKKNSE
jgi:predicted transglutaminase-like cysteine proteinase